MSSDSLRVVAFPYHPPHNAPYAKLCLQAQSGQEVRLLRCMAGWSILYADGAVGLFPLDYIVEKKLCHKEADAVKSDEEQKREEKSPTPMQMSTDIDLTLVTDTVDDGVDGLGANTSLSSSSFDDSDVVGGKGPGLFRRPRSCIAGRGGRAVTSHAESVQGDTNNSGDRLFRRVHHSGVCEDSDKSSNNHRKTRGMQAESPLGCPASRSMPDSSEEDFEIKTVRKIGRVLGSSRCRIRSPSSVAHGSQVTAEEENIPIVEVRRMLEGHCSKLNSEADWMHRFSNGVQAAHQHLRDVRTCASTTGEVEKQGLQSRCLSEKEFLAKVKKCTSHLRFIVLSHKAASRLSSSVSSHGSSPCDASCDADTDKSEDDCGSPGYTERSPSQSLGHTSDVKAMKVCIRRELETLSNYSAQKQKLCDRMGLFERIHAAMVAESRELRESEVALDQIAPPEVCRVLYSPTGSPERATAPVHVDAVSAPVPVVNQEDIEVITKEGFEWPATLPGMTDEEKAMVDGHRRVVEKYENKCKKLIQQREAQEKARRESSTIAKLQRALSTGDAALRELQLEVEAEKAFVSEHEHTAAVLKEQLIITRKLLQRRLGGSRPEPGLKR
ncbi:hypothetical protein ERJ75_000274900 [Trypanosoma vivax]|uniref:SH3 domain-containing protein n=1 Tax=Trypanosoma vivax (strain Y486) TaxID=1055687 RepID=G0U5D0_TRYVY|nr:hypothetical protein TRVL_01861 [Trypanosoma vivax]KAH8618379.1 hypothetical protein ERJ75_000274900 [Trypanosoma vivax]CCC51078.1 conserved hypothetical protein [Trypanosoma vivax Y486]